MSGNGETAGSPNARQALLTAVDEHAGDAGAPVGDVIEAALEDVNGGLGRVCSALQQLHADGEVYQPNPTTVRRVATDTDLDDADRWITADTVAEVTR